MPDVRDLHREVGAAARARSGSPGGVRTGDANGGGPPAHAVRAAGRAERASATRSTPAPAPHGSAA
ncbi:hypothetical protein BURPS668_A0933 [Burkholderia pseudomallei 668]|nr:hypothetical protein BURPS668_A0933 [Burkholderia pseudomallei 668]